MFNETQTQIMTGDILRTDVVLVNPTSTAVRGDKIIGNSLIFKTNQGDFRSYVPTLNTKTGELRFVVGMSFTLNQITGLVNEQTLLSVPMQEALNIGYSQMKTLEKVYQHLSANGIVKVDWELNDEVAKMMYQSLPMWTIRLDDGIYLLKEANADKALRLDGVWCKRPEGGKMYHATPTDILIDAFAKVA